MIADSLNRVIEIGSYICYATGDKHLSYGKVLNIFQKEKLVEVLGVSYNWNSKSPELNKKSGILKYPGAKILVLPGDFFPDEYLKLYGK